MILTRCESHSFAVRSIDEARSIVALMINTVSPECAADMAHVATKGRPGDCPAASFALYLVSAAWRETGQK